MDGSAAQSIYRLEKERAMQERRLSHTALMAEAKEAFNKLLADAQLARKGGRPRTNPLPPGARPPVKPAAAAPAVVAPVEAAPAKATAVKAEAPVRRKTDKGQSKAPAKPKALKTSAKKVAKPVKKSQAKRAKPQPKASLRSKKSR
jgi:hypothetical protein